MAIFDATNASSTVRFIYGTDLIDFQSELQATDVVYEWRTSSGDTVTAFGNFSYDASGNLVSGVVTSVNINLSNNSNVDIEITEIDDANILLLLQGHRSFCREVLSGNDTFMLPTGSGSFLVGDYPSFVAENGALTDSDGGDDTFTQVLTGNSTAYLRGDFESFRSTETIYAGSDHFIISGATNGTSAIMGDATNLKEGTLVGGDDIIDTSGLLTGKFIIYGDIASLNSGTLFGGDDRIFAGDGGITATGDASSLSSVWVFSIIDAGNDEIHTGSGNDYVYGDVSSFFRGSLTSGDDLVFAGSGLDHLYGDISSISDSNSSSIFVAGNDTIYGGDGTDWIRGDIGGIQSGSGILASNITFGNDTLFGGDGDDDIFGDFENDFDGILAPNAGGDDYIDGGNGDDYMDAAGHVNGDTAGYRTAESGVVVSLMLQGTAQDTVGAGLDTLIGFENLTGSSFGDTLTGDGQRNLLYGRAGYDTIFGNGGDDRIKGQSGRDELHGDEGNDKLLGGTGNDTLFGGLHNDVLEGGSGRDQLFGGDGTDRLKGHNSDDSLFGGSGSDVLLGGNGNDLVAGGAGNDRLTGGAHADYFHFYVGDDVDTVTDFQNNKDTIYLDAAFNGSGLSMADFLTLYGSIIDGDAVLDFGGGDVLIVENVSVIGMLGNDIEFV